MRVEIKVDASTVETMLKAYPKEMGEALSEYVERGGRRIEAEAKRQAPAITGNLRRQIRFIHSSPFVGVVKAFANYSGFVHGEPYWTPKARKNGRMRRTTPFFTIAHDITFNARERDAQNLIKDVTRRLMQ